MSIWSSYVARATDIISGVVFDRPVEEIIVEDGWRGRIESLARRRRDVWVVAGIVVAIVLAGLALRARTPGPRIAPPARAQAGAEYTPAAGVVVVHVAGAVRAPGIYELDDGGRVADAIEAAGGPRPRADLDAVNLAEVVVDGAKIEVLRKGAAPVAGTVPGPAVTPGTSVPALIDLNTADQTALETIPGVGPVTAAAILQFRAEQGSFTAIEQLLDVTGIGPATLEAIRPYVTL
jgi:competence protein ComEA